MRITVAGTQILQRVSNIATGWPAYSGTSVLLCLSACALAALEHVSMCSWTCMADGSSLCILARMAVLSQHWYNSSAGDGSLVLIGVAQSPSKARCELALLYLAHWSVCLMDLPQQIHWIVGNADLRFHVWCPKTYRSQQTGHSHIVGHCQSEGLWECHALKLGTHILWAIVRVKDFGNAMLWKHLLQQWDNLVGIALAMWKMLNKDHLWVEVTHNQVINSFEHEDICGTHLPWVWWCGCRCERCCSILALESGAGFTLADYFLDGLVNAGLEETSMCEQLWFCYSLMELMQLMQDSLPFSGRNE